MKTGNFIHFSYRYYYLFFQIGYFIHPHHLQKKHAGLDLLNMCISLLYFELINSLNGALIKKKIRIYAQRCIRLILVLDVKLVQISFISITRD